MGKIFSLAKCSFAVKVAKHSFAGQSAVTRLCFRLDKQTWQRKSKGTQKTISQNLLLKFFVILWQNFYFYRIWNNKNFKMKVEQTNFVTHLIITLQLLYY